MAKQIGYREFCEYVVFNDDITELTNASDSPSTCLMSAICHLYNKEWEEVRKTLCNLIDKHELSKD